ncbi:RhoGEF domain-containing protein [Phakopsora pachyrhizi]|nr:RhoGEF domain-containing protein [Phakopsora pachyrhizi]
MSSLPYDQPISSAPSRSGGPHPSNPRRPGWTSNEALYEERGTSFYVAVNGGSSSSTPNLFELDASSELKNRSFTNNQLFWDDLEDSSPLFSGFAQLPNQAVTLVEEGKSRIVDASLSSLSIDNLVIPEDTTHLLLSKTASPLLVGSMVFSKLPSIAPTLVVLDISDAGLSSLPVSLASCIALEELKISGNVLTSGDIPPFLSNLKSLKVFAADRCGLQQLTYSLAPIKNLRDLSFCYNHLKCLPSWISSLSQLEVLLVDGNDFEPPWLELVEPLLMNTQNWCRLVDCSTQLPSSTTKTTSLELSETFSASASLESPNVTLGPSSRVQPELSNGGPSERLVSSWAKVDRSDADLLGPYPSSPGARSAADQTEFETFRCDSAAGYSDVEKRSSYLRRLRSTSDMRNRRVSRPLSLHDHQELSLASLIGSDLASTSGLNFSDFKATPKNSKTSQSLFTASETRPGSKRRPSTASIARETLSPTSSAVPLPTSANRIDQKGLTTLEITPPISAPASSSSSSAVSRQIDHQKKSFGFLKKMSLGKLRREPFRSRTSSIDAMASSSTQGPPTVVGGSSLPVLQDSPQSLSADGHLPSHALGTDGKNKLPAGTNNPDTNPNDWELRAESTKKKPNNRRSFLKLESYSTVNPMVLRTEGPHHNGPAYKLYEHPPHGTNRGKNLATEGRTPSSSDNKQSVHGILTRLRSIMMYLRDVHDLSGEAHRYGGAITSTGGTFPIIPTISRASSTKMSGSNLSTVSETAIHHTPGDEGRVNGAHVTHTSGTAAEMDGDANEGSPLVPTGIAGGSSILSGSSEQIKVTNNAKRRLNVIEEIVSTEKSYIRGLKELQEIYIASASLLVSSSIGKEKEPVVPPLERKTVFNNVEAIIGFHVDVLLPDFQGVMDKLAEKKSVLISSWTRGNKVSDTDAANLKWEEIENQLASGAAEDLARVFIRHAAFLKLYSTYITQFDFALERLREWNLSSGANPPTQSSGFSAVTSAGSAGSITSNHNHHHALSHGQKKRLKAYLKRCRAHMSHTQMNLESYLLMPVQRLPRYKLLLENLVSCTPDLSQHPVSPPPAGSVNKEGDLPSSGMESSEQPNNSEMAKSLAPNRLVVEALNIISSVTAEMNERKRDSEGRQRLLYWQQRFGNKFRSPLVQPHRTLIKEGTMTLMRTVKLTTKDSVIPGQLNGRAKVPVLSTDSQSISMIVLLCTDLLVLVKDAGDGGKASSSSPAGLFQALRLAQHSRPQISLPATIFGADQSMIRFVDSRAIFYFQCDGQRSALEWVGAINQQVPLL